MVETESGLSRFCAYVEGNPFIDWAIMLAEGQIIFESYPKTKALYRSGLVHHQGCGNHSSGSAGITGSSPC
ncbi:MAG: hypothetical protein CBC67_05290 [Gammaproteobacteria bacterium TMED107]|nr:MAG: hypothetical protein CBC67_05290 [Gammaproteobacteria bacterium TMED107]